MSGETRWPRLISADAITTLVVVVDDCWIIQRDANTTAARPAAVATTNITNARAFFMSFS
jgi:hypothetical protein